MEDGGGVAGCKALGVKGVAADELVLGEDDEVVEL